MTEQPTPVSPEEPTPEPIPPARPALRQTTWWMGAIVLVVGGIGAQVAGAVALVAALAIKVIVEGGDIARIQQEASNMSFSVLAPSVIATGLTMAFCAFALPLIARASIRESLGLRSAPWPTFLAAPVGIVALGPTSDAMHRFMVWAAPNFTLGALDTLDGLTRSAPIWMVVPALALVPGVCEELLFRGAFQRSIRNPWIAIILSGLLFALYHTDPHHIAAVLPLGFYLAWLGARTKSLFVPITAHVVNNSVAVIASVMTGSSTDESWEDWYLMPAGWGVAAIAIAVVWWSTRPKPPPPELPPAPTTF